MAQAVASFRAAIEFEDEGAAPTVAAEASQTVGTGTAHEFSGTASFSPPLRELVAGDFAAILQKLYEEIGCLDELREPRAVGQEELERIRLLAPSLAEDFRNARRPSNAAGLVEVIEGRNAVIQRVKQLENSARSTVRLFDTPPHATPAAVNQEELQGLSKGVVWRTIYSHGSVEIAQRSGSLKAEVAAGEQARVLEELPVEMLIVDDETAVIPLVVSGRGSSNYPPLPLTRSNDRLV